MNGIFQFQVLSISTRVKIINKTKIQQTRIFIFKYAKPFFQKGLPVDVVFAHSGGFPSKVRTRGIALK